MSTAPPARGTSIPTLATPDPPVEEPWLAEHWTLMLAAVADRLRRAVATPQLTMPALCAVVLECAEALDQLQAALPLERATRAPRDGATEPVWTACGGSAACCEAPPGLRRAGRDHAPAHADGPGRTRR